MNAAWASFDPILLRFSFDGKTTGPVSHGKSTVQKKTKENNEGCEFHCREGSQNR
jgi:hypothetical protein